MLYKKPLIPINLWSFFEPLKCPLAPDVGYYGNERGETDNGCCIAIRQENILLKRLPLEEFKKCQMETVDSKVQLWQKINFTKLIFIAMQFCSVTQFATLPLVLCKIFATVFFRGLLFMYFIIATVSIVNSNISEHFRCTKQFPIKLCRHY